MSIRPWIWFSLFLAYSGTPTRAGFTAADDEYQLILKKSPDVLRADSLCFTDTIVRFRMRPEGERVFLNLGEINLIERNPYREKWVGCALGGGILLGGILGNYMLGGGNSPGAFVDRKAAHILTGMFLVPIGMSLGTMLGEILGTEFLFHARTPGKYTDRRIRYGCGSDSIADVPGFSDGLRADGRPPGSAASDYRNLKPDIEKQAHADSVLLSGTRRNRIALMSGGFLLLPGEGEITAENLRISFTRFFRAR